MAMSPPLPHGSNSLTDSCSTYGRKLGQNGRLAACGGPRSGTFCAEGHERGLVKLKPGWPSTQGGRRGGQERGRRPGTENGAALVGFATAVEWALQARDAVADAVAAADADTVAAAVVDALAPVDSVDVGVRLAVAGIDADAVGAAVVDGLTPAASDLVGVVLAVASALTVPFVLLGALAGVQAAGPGVL